MKKAFRPKGPRMPNPIIVQSDILRRRLESTPQPPPEPTPRETMQQPPVDPLLQDEVIINLDSEERETDTPQAALSSSADYVIAELVRPGPSTTRRMEVPEGGQTPAVHHAAEVDHARPNIIKIEVPERYRRASFHVAGGLAIAALSSHRHAGRSRSRRARNRDAVANVDASAIRIPGEYTPVLADERYLSRRFIPCDHATRPEYVDRTNASHDYFYTDDITRPCMGIYNCNSAFQPSRLAEHIRACHSRHEITYGSVISCCFDSWPSLIHPQACHFNAFDHTFIVSWTKVSEGIWVNVKYCRSHLLNSATFRHRVVITNPNMRIPMCTGMVNCHPTDAQHCPHCNKSVARTIIRRDELLDDMHFDLKVTVFEN